MRQLYNKDGTAYKVGHQLWSTKCNQVFVHEGETPLSIHVEIMSL